MDGRDGLSSLDRVVGDEDVDQGLARKDGLAPLRSRSREGPAAEDRTLESAG